MSDSSEKKMSVLTRHHACKFLVIDFHETWYDESLSKYLSHPQAPDLVSSSTHLFPHFRIFGPPGIGERPPGIGESCQNEGLVFRSRFSWDLVQWKFIQVSFTFTNPSARIGERTPGIGESCQNEGLWDVTPSDLGRALGIWQMLHVYTTGVICTLCRSL